jgi:hypothetical protein
MSPDQLKTAKNIWEPVVQHMITQFPAGSQASEPQRLILYQALVHQLTVMLEKNSERAKSQGVDVEANLKQFAEMVANSFYQAVFVDQVPFRR